jgi:hypothetical protein
MEALNHDENFRSLICGVVLAGALLSLPALASEVHAAIDGVNSTKGRVMCGILRSADG